tara:strand:+ start:675 stop:839 length:165 start_codon:yes stop_codon:yes gene_type:complete
MLLEIIGRLLLILLGFISVMLITVIGFQDEMRILMSSVCIGFTMFAFWVATPKS